MRLEQKEAKQYLHQPGGGVRKFVHWFRAIHKGAVCCHTANWEHCEVKGHVQDPERQSESASALYSDFSSSLLSFIGLGWMIKSSGNVL